MKIVTLLLVAVGLFSCTPSDQDRARRESHEVAQQAEADAKKVGNAVDKDLKKTRDKVNEELDKHK
jgi:hypothetical protein